MPSPILESARATAGDEKFQIRIILSTKQRIYGQLRSTNCVRVFKNVCIIERMRSQSYPYAWWIKPNYCHSSALTAFSSTHQACVYNNNNNSKNWLLHMEPQLFIVTIVYRCICPEKRFKTSLALVSMCCAVEFCFWCGAFYNVMCAFLSGGLRAKWRCFSFELFAQFHRSGASSILVLSR